LPNRFFRPHEAAMSAAGTDGGKHESDVTIRIARLTRGELSVLLHQTVSQLPHLREGSIELRNAHANLVNIRRMLARPDFRPR
jgi:hypothetical protein